MKLENVFEFINPETIRIKGTRVGIESVYQHIYGSYYGEGKSIYTEN